MFDAEKCKKQGWKCLVYGDGEWKIAKLSFYTNNSTYASNFDKDSVVANLPDQPAEPTKESP